MHKTNKKKCHDLAGASANRLL